MADAKKKAAPAAKKAEIEFKYGVEDVATKLGIQPASARIALRKAGVKKEGKSYGWNSQTELAAVIKKLTEGKTAEKKPAKEKASA